MRQNFKYFLALDFEAQCQQGKRIQPQEIIEFPCIMVDAQNFQIVDTFHQYIKVIYNLDKYSMNHSFSAYLLPKTHSFLHGADRDHPRHGGRLRHLGAHYGELHHVVQQPRPQHGELDLCHVRQLGSGLVSAWSVRLLTSGHSLSAGCGMVRKIC